MSPNLLHSWQVSLWAQSGVSARCTSMSQQTSRRSSPALTSRRVSELYTTAVTCTRRKYLLFHKKIYALALLR